MDGSDLAEIVVQRLMDRHETVALAGAAGLVSGWLGDVSGVSAVLWSPS